MVNKYAVFAGYQCEDPNRGWNTYQDSFQTFVDAFQHLRKLMQDDEMEWAQIVDLEKRQLVYEV